MIKLSSNPELQHRIESLALALGAEVVAIHRDLPETYFADTSERDSINRFLYRQGVFGEFKDCPTDF